jgi:molybdenum cofactor cytidylyltransferase
LRRQVIQVANAAGMLLSDPVFYPTGKKLLAKGHLLSSEDVRLLVREGYDEVPVNVLEDSDVSEEEAAVEIAMRSALGSLEIRIGAGGRANLVATESCCTLVDETLLRQLNDSGVVTAATLPTLSFAFAEQRLATIKSAPFGVPRRDYERTLAQMEKAGAMLQARPVSNPTIGVLYSDPFDGERARILFEGIMRTRLERFGMHAAFALAAKEEDELLTRNLQHLLRARPTMVLMASTTAPAGPDDVVGQAIKRVGGDVERFMAPVEPGNLLLLAYVGDIPIVAAPGCFRSPRANVVDLVLPALLAQLRLSGADIAALGHGGLLQ